MVSSQPQLIRRQNHLLIKFGKFHILNSIFTTTSTARYNYGRNSRYLSATGVFGGVVHSTTSPDPGSSGGLNEIREANSLSLNLEALAIPEI